MADGYRDGYIRALEDTDDLYESEILRITFGNAYGGRENPQLAAALLERFPSVKSIIEADLSEITAVDGVPENFALYLKTLDRIYKQMTRNDLIINSTQDCLKVLSERFRAKDNEYVEIYLVNKNGRVTEVKSYTSHKADRVDVSANSILSVISSSNAYGLYFAHNHVNASVNPSADDDDVTGKIFVACNMCNIKFFDHCIINSRGDTFSYAQSGRLKLITDKRRK